jgi:hypothetical protein
MRGQILAVSGKGMRLGLVSRVGLGVALALTASCGGNPAANEELVTGTSALTAQDILGFETLGGWTASSGVVTLTTTRTQGAAALAVRAPVNYTPIVSAAIGSSAAGIAGLSAAGSVLNVDLLLPVQQPNPYYFGALQMFVSVPSRSVFNQYLGQVELTGRPLGTFQTLAFSVPDAVRNSLRGATFSDLTFTLALNAPFGATGTYILDNLRVAGVVAADFAISASPAGLAVPQGASVATTVTIAPTGGFAGTVTLSTGALPAGVTATFAPPTVTSGGTSTLTLVAASNAVLVAATPITITGTSGSLAHATTVTLSVSGDFTIAETPSSLSVIQGQSVAATVAIFPVGGFAGTVTLGVTGLPGGVTATFSPPTIVASGSSTLTLAASPAAVVTPAATITVTAQSGSVTHSVTFVLTVLPVPAPEFTLGVSPTGVSVTQGFSGAVLVTTTSIDGFAGTINLTTGPLPAGVTATFLPPAIVGGGNSTLFLAASSTAAIVTSVPVTVTGTSGSFVHSATVTLAVLAAPVPDFSIAETPSTVTVVTGGTASISVAVFAEGGFAGVVDLAATGLPNGVSAAFSPASLAGGGFATLTLAASDTADLTPASTITITGSSGSLSHSVTFVLSVVAAP